MLAVCVLVCNFSYDRFVLHSVNADRYLLCKLRFGFIIHKQRFYLKIIGYYIFFRCLKCVSVYLGYTVGIDIKHNLFAFYSACGIIGALHAFYRDIITTTDYGIYSVFVCRCSVLACITFYVIPALVYDDNRLILA